MAPFIIGYLYDVEFYCPRCITRALPTGPGQRYDGWDLAPGVRMSTEDNLDEIAAAFHIDRRDENSFDSSEFPKVQTRQMAEADGYRDLCAFCQEPLLEEF